MVIICICQIQITLDAPTFEICILFEPHRHGKISLDRTEISKKIGQLFIERNSVNLYSDILDTPEFFWEQEQFQTFYHRIYSYLEIGKRVAVLNKRLDIMKELFEMLGAELQDRHSSNLEVCHSPVLPSSC